MILKFPEVLLAVQTHCKDDTAKVVTCYWWLKGGCSVKETFQDYKKKRHEIISLYTTSALRSYLHAHIIYILYIYIFMCEDNSSSFYKMISNAPKQTSKKA